MHVALAFPSADEIAHLVVAAANLTGEHPIGVIASSKSTRGRAYVFHILRERYRYITLGRLARVLGTDGSDAQLSFLRTAPKARWWEQLIVEELHRNDSVATARIAFAPSHAMRQVPVTAALMGDPDPARIREVPAVLPRPTSIEKHTHAHRTDCPKRTPRVKPILPSRFYAGAQPRAGR